MTRHDTAVPEVLLGLSCLVAMPLLFILAVPEGRELTRLAVVKDMRREFAKGETRTTGRMISAFPRPKNNSIEYRFSLADGREYDGIVELSRASDLRLGQAVPVVYATSDPIASCIPGRMISVSFPKDRLVEILAAFVVLVGIGHYARRRSKRGVHAIGWICLPIMATAAGLCYGARYLSDARDQYTVQIGDNVWEDRTVEIAANSQHPDVLVWEDQLWVNGHPMGKLKYHEHVRLEDGWVLQNGQKVVKY